MESARYDVERYLDDMNEYRECLANELEDAGNEARRLIDEWDSAVSAFNNR
jgi:hypothetical protein